jgi:hypothetical protein
MITTGSILRVFLEENGLEIVRHKRYKTDAGRLMDSIGIRPSEDSSPISLHAFTDGTIIIEHDWSLQSIRTNIHNPDSLDIVLRYVTKWPRPEREWKL